MFINSNYTVSIFSQVEDLSEEAVVVRHEKCEHEEKKRFLSYLKIPLGYGRSRYQKRTDSRAESSGANTPDPMSPHNLDQQELTNSPLTSPPDTPLPGQLDESISLPSIAVMRRRTVSQTKLFKDRELKEENICSFAADVIEVLFLSHFMCKETAVSLLKQRNNIFLNYTHLKKKMKSRTI